ncbi:MAG TPA: hypothetical protein VLV17_08050, partial [Anaeromyxobacteraceae bacterium]|nr:hypothetical protein [Anaeromyxobacteraceae bacterium]
MRSASSARALLGLALLAAGCGNWSNEDVAFVEALPTSQHLHVALPPSAAQAASSGTAPATALTVTCPAPGASQVWGWAQPAGDALNALVEGMLVFVDYVRSITPTSRMPDERIWGPFSDQNHPGKQDRVRMSRSVDASGLPDYTYYFEAEPTGSGDAYTDLLDGEFSGSTAELGKGTFTLHFDALRTLGMDDNPATDPTGPLVATYDRTGDPRLIGLDVQNGTTLAEFNYAYQGFANGNGSFSYKFVDGSGDSFVVVASFDAAGEGKASVSVTLSSL